MPHLEAHIGLASLQLSHKVYIRIERKKTRTDGALPDDSCEVFLGAPCLNGGAAIFVE